MLGLGHAILTGETLIGDQPFAVHLADDLCYSPDQVLSQMVGLYKKHQCSIVAVEEVPKDETQKYGVIDGEEIEEGLIKITNMVENHRRKMRPPTWLLLVAIFLPRIFLTSSGNTAGQKR